MPLIATSKAVVSVAFVCGLLASSRSPCADADFRIGSKKLSSVEYLYAEVSDANTILATIDSGLLSSYQGRDRGAWMQFYSENRARLVRELESLSGSGLSRRDIGAIAAMRKQMKGFIRVEQLSREKARCLDSTRHDIAYSELKSALVACFVEIGNSLSFEGGKINRVSALDLLHETADPGRRKAVFLAFAPLWQAINSNNEPDSPYRRMIAAAAIEGAKGGSEIAAAARDVGINPREVERWLVQILWPSDLFAEAFADVPAWSTYEPIWQRRYLGHEAPEQLSLRALYSVVMLDVAWSLFEVRMLRAPQTDPNALWTEITRRYLHVVPHPEFSWWAVRVQLADLPGYMVNYGLGAILTAEMREHISEALGVFDAGDPRLYGWLSERLLRYGSERDTRSLLDSFLGHSVSPQALLEQIRRLKPRITAGDG